ncbi:HNH endonuclease signature motif containing protein [Arthrobacter celericrescens]|uniref:HNH endonuclease signature motif containing protein n=1 Tax=Arthrobacter celericrescens TaxID=2320851 RepID=UPI000EA151B8|nr:HNH endonuclease signature motif containing protein [Arthrobacter celericrescens]
METTTSLDGRTPQPAAAFDPLDVLDGLVSTLESVESAIAGLQALREYALAIASKVAEVMAAEDMDDGGKNGGGAPAGFKGARWDAAELAHRAVAAEIATATRANDRTIQRQMGQAVELLDRFPGAFGALAQGRISLAHARVIQDAGSGLDDPAALARYEAVVVECAERQAPGRVRRLAVREAEKAQPEPLITRHERACEERRVWVTPLPDGMAELAAILPAAVAYGIHDRLTNMARAHADMAKSHADADMAQHSQPGAFGPAWPTHQAGPAVGDRNPVADRTTDQLRADLLSDLLLRSAPAGHDTPDGLLAAITGRVDVTVPVLTLIGQEGAATSNGSAGRAFRTDASGNTARAGAPDTVASQVPAELDGRHPIDPATARILAGQATVWNRVLTDPYTGAVLAVDRYRPGEDLKRLLAARDTRCRFPCCGIPARELDLDHTHDAALGGATEAGNLAGLCRRHHMLKHHSRWNVRQTGAGVLEWTSATGRTYTDHPPVPATHIPAAAQRLRAAQGDAPKPGDASDPPPF